METPSEDVSHKLQAGYRLLFERNPMPMWVYDVETLRMLAVNEAALAQYGYSRQELVGLTLPELHHEDEVAQLHEHLELPLDAQRTPRLWQHRHRDGGFVEVEVATEELELDGIRARMAVVRDMTAQRRAEQAQRDLEQRLLEERETLSAVLDSTSDGIISTDAEGLIKTFNPGAERIFLCTQASMQGQSIEVLLPERFRAAHRQRRQRFAESGEPSRMMGLGLVKGLRSDGRELDLEGAISLVSVRQQQLLIINLRDVTERVRADAEFEQSRAQLSDLTQRLMTQEKTVVKRLAQALHDQLGQTMAAIRMSHETIMTLQQEKASSGIDRLQAQMGTLIGQAIRQVRQVLIDLRPPLLDEHGLAAALDNELRNRSLAQPRFDISIDVQPEIALMRWSTEVEYAAFMVAREAVENAWRHSGASSVALRMTGTATSLQLEVADKGVGIAAGATLRSGHLGILGMQERAQAIGATVTVDSGGVPGTRVRFSWQSVPLI